MFKFLVLGVLLCHEIYEITAAYVPNIPRLQNCTDESLTYYDGKSIGPHCFVLNGVGATKVHEDKVTWNIARHKCVLDGGHLAIINSKDEFNVIKLLLIENSIGRAWVGYHDTFEEGKWTTLFDNPVSDLDGHLSLNFHNSTDKNCALFVTTADGLTDEHCTDTYPYVCKLSI